MSRFVLLTDPFLLSVTSGLNGCSNIAHPIQVCQTPASDYSILVEASTNFFSRSVPVWMEYFPIMLFSTTQSRIVTHLNFKPMLPTIAARI